MVQQFNMPDGTQQRCKIMNQRVKKFDTMSIRISFILTDTGTIDDIDGIEVYTADTLYIYEEINNDTGRVICTKTISENDIKRDYQWFSTIRK